MKAKAIESSASARCSWQPNFQLHIQDNNVGVVGADGEIVWNPEAVQKALGTNVEAIKQELVEFKQR